MPVESDHTCKDAGCFILRYGTFESGFSSFFLFPLGLSVGFFSRIYLCGSFFYC